MYKKVEPAALQLAEPDACHLPDIPRYLVETYWWAYVHPRAVRFFDQALIVNVILMGNYRRLRNAALDALGSTLSGRTLQVACVYGDFTTAIATRLAPDAALDVVDILPIQLENLRRKLPATAQVGLYRRDSAALGFEVASYDQAIVFFLVHEQPEAVRRDTLAEVLRVVKPGGRVVVVDYHKPHWLNPLRYLLKPMLARLEPFALDLWRENLRCWLPEHVAQSQMRKRTFFGGLYQKIVIEV